MVSTRFVLGALFASLALAHPHGMSPSPSSSPTATSQSPGPTTFAYLRIIGDSDTKLFEGTVQNRGPMQLSTQQGGQHACGTEFSSGREAGGSGLTVLAIAGQHKGFDFDGPFNATSKDFEVTRVGNFTAAGAKQWELFMHFSPTPEPRTCMAPLDWDENVVIWVYNRAQYQHMLRAQAPKTVTHGTPFDVTVTDWVTGKPVEGATVADQKTDASGKASITLQNCSETRLRATLDGSLESNGLLVTNGPYWKPGISCK